MLMDNNNEYSVLFDIAQDLFSDVSTNDINELYYRLEECTESKMPENVTDSDLYIKKACHKIKNIVVLERSVA